MPQTLPLNPKAPSSFMNHLDEIRAKLSVEELVGGYVQLKQAGRNLKGLCPFHNDTRPSFMVSPEKGIAYCFSCNNGGDIFKFIQLVEKVEFPEAVRILAERTGVKLPDFKPGQRDERQSLLKANQAAADFYGKKLTQDEASKAYFLARGLKEQTIKSFQLGFSPDSYRSLKEHLVEKGFAEIDLLKGGLLNQRSLADKNTYDRFRNRLMFPILDHQGNVVGFGGRIMGEGEPKYLNSPDTPVYNKSFVLYGLNRAKKAIKEQDLAIFVEGYMDVITCHQAGSENVVATSGTALTASQLKLIKRYTRNIAFAFDQDTAGMEATLRAIELAQESELNLKIIMVPGGKDPDECIQHDKEAWFKAVKESIPVMEFYFAHALRQHDKGTLEGKKAIAEFLLPLIKTCPTHLEQDIHLKKLAFTLGVDDKMLWEDLKQLRQKKEHYSPMVSRNEEGNLPAKKITFTYQDYLLGFILNYPETYSYLETDLMGGFDLPSDTEKIYKSLKNLYDSKRTVDGPTLKKELPESLHEKIDILPLLIEEQYPEIDLDLAKKEVLNLIKRINHTNLKSAQKAITLKIRAAQSDEEKLKFLQEYQMMLEKMNKE